MRENLLKALWQDGAYAVNGWVTLPATFSAEIMAQQGWDSLTIDLQHGLIDYQTAVGILQAISTTPTVPLVRVPWLDPAIIMKVLDAGAYGVICPMINSAAQAAAFVAACRYPPAGIRSCGPIRANIYAGPADLFLALGCEPRIDPTEKVVVQAIEYIVARAQEKKIVPGIHTESPA